jgi:hypothetical protein
MRILVAHAFYRQAGGEDRYVMRQIELLRRRHEVRLPARHNDKRPLGIRTAMKMVQSRAMKQRAERVISDFRRTSYTCKMRIRRWGPLSNWVLTTRDPAGYDPCTITGFDVPTGWCSPKVHRVRWLWLSIPSP